MSDNCRTSFHETDHMKLLHTAVPADAATARPWIVLEGGGTGFVRHDWLDAFGNSGLRTVSDFLSISGDPLSKPGLGRRYRARLLLSKDGRPEVVYLKRFGPDRWAQRAASWLRRGGELPAEREARLSEALASDGIAVGRVLAWGVGQVEGGGHMNFVILAAVPGVPAHHWLAQAKHGADAWRRQRHASENLARFAAQFHRLGWRHRDFYLCHIFILEEQTSLHLIDLQRVFRPWCCAGRWLIKDLAQLNYSAVGEDVSRTLRLRFIKRYFSTPRLTRAQKGIVRQILQKTARIARHDARRAARYGASAPSLSSEHQA